MTEQPVFSTRDVESFSPPGSPRSYLIAPLNYRERAAMRSDLLKRGGKPTDAASLCRAIRVAVEARSPGNAAELVAVVDAIEAGTTDQTALAQFAAIEAACADDPLYAELQSAHARFMSMHPFAAAKFALRGWEGEGLPPFLRKLDAVPDDLLDQLPDDEVALVGQRASILMSPGAAASGNSALPSPSPASRKPATGASSRKTAGGGSSRARNTRPTRA